MNRVNNVFIIGAEEEQVKIGGLFSTAGLKVTTKGDTTPIGIATADMVVECLATNLEARKEAWQRWMREASPNSILATTASWGVTEIAAVTGRPEVFVGLNFTFNPLEQKCLVQIVKGLDTRSETIKTCQSIAEQIGVQAIVVEDSPGLVLDRVMAGTINEAVTMYAIGIASIEDIDRILKSCLNWPMGPFEFADTIGLDKLLATLEVLSERDGPRFLPNQLLKKMVASGRLGKKTSKGFYTYS